MVDRGFWDNKGPFDKPLKDWTLEEVANYCKGGTCEECTFSGGYDLCPFADHDSVPEIWELLLEED